MTAYLTTVSSATYYVTAASNRLTISSTGGIDVTSKSNWGILAASLYGSVYNQGHVTAANPTGGPNYGILLQAGGVITNELGGVITSGLLGSAGYGSGVKITGGKDSGIEVVNELVNAGTIQQLGTSPFHSYGVSLNGVGAIVNNGTISGYEAGVVITGVGTAGATLHNAGLIKANATSSSFPGIGVNMLGPTGEVDNIFGGTIIGRRDGIDADGGQITVIEGGSISGGDYAIYGVKKIELIPGYHVSGKIAGYHGQTSLVLGPSIYSGIVGTASGFGTNITGISDITFAAAWDISGNQAGIAGGQTFSGFGRSDAIYITGVGKEAVAGFANNTLSLEGATSLNLILPGGTYTAESFNVQNFTNGTARISTRCFASGTRVRTPAGDVPVEDLRRGQFVERLDGGPAEIVRIHRRVVDCRRGSAFEDARPVRILARAFGADRPTRDLWLSPDHAVFLNGALIPVRYLANGTTIRRTEVDQVVYFHIELAGHDVLLAEGLAVESYLPSDDAATAAGPRLDVWECNACAPLVVTGPKLREARAMLANASGLDATGPAEPAWMEPAPDRTGQTIRD